jgi:hypothetical protein
MELTNKLMKALDMKQKTQNLPSNPTQQDASWETFSFSASQDIPRLD